MSFLSEFRDRNGLVPVPFWSRGLQFGILGGTLVGIVLYRAWGLLACPLIFLPLILVTSSLKRIYWSGFDPFIWKASDTGRFDKVMFWNGLTVAFDWLIPFFTILFCLFLMGRFPTDADVPRTLRAFAFWCAISPPRLSARSDIPFLTDPDRIERVTTLAVLALLPLGVPVDPWHLVCALCLATLVGIPSVIWSKLPGYRRDYEKLLNETRCGFIHDYRQARSWFPRPGVIFEPQVTPYLPVDQVSFAQIRECFTVLRANAWGFFLSLFALIGGCVGTVCVGRMVLLLLVPVFVLVGLIYGSLVSQADRTFTGADRWARGILVLGAICAIAVPTLYFGGRDPAALAALGVLFSASWFFCAGFLVRATSHGVFDTLEYLLVLGALAGIILARTGGCVWYEALLPALFFCFLLPWIRQRFPRTDLPPPDESLDDSTRPNAAAARAASSDAQMRSARKRERQLAALRRSSRRSDR